MCFVIPGVYGPTYNGYQRISIQGLNHAVFKYTHTHTHTHTSSWNPVSPKPQCFVFVIVSWEPDYFIQDVTFTSEIQWLWLTPKDILHFTIPLDSKQLSSSLTVIVTASCTQYYIITAYT